MLTLPCPRVERFHTLRVSRMHAGQLDELTVSMVNEFGANIKSTNPINWQWSCAY
jgi:hypothetical protein